MGRVRHHLPSMAWRARWWHRHQIMWFYRYHPEWAVMDSSWLNEDGDYDNDNSWHDAYWWHQEQSGFLLRQSSDLDFMVSGLA